MSIHRIHALRKGERECDAKRIIKQHTLIAQSTTFLFVDEKLENFFTTVIYYMDD